MASTAVAKRIMALLAEGSAKPNKLRKSVMSHPTVQAAKATWDDFKATLEALEASGQVDREVQADFSELCSLAGAPKKKRALAESPETSVKKAKRKEDDLSDSELQPATSGPKVVMTATMEVPTRFVPFLLRLGGQKVKNIEVNTKTHIQCGSKGVTASSRDSKTPGTQLPTATLERLAAGDHEGKDDMRTLTITGGEAKHLKGAQILIEKMLDAFQGKPTGHAGKGSGGKDGKGGKGGKGQKNKGKGKSSGGPTGSDGPSGSGEPKKKSRDRKFY